ncbi:ABC-type nitrate/sulfonate/bicarbonate transport system permease component [Jatrophihabitans sp. GAS493]|uniref:ABC transporter permease n=1 Tax=Jatrophihabitans sp. GAS493 TaxID=1907575 RepID=UPI000BB725CC|nr:ABC transporter permease subunit [Jatrophihabitans sp. GAS493]SOD71966.1 ABC-type nitrate/sulfonate/bicarbonate transport system permease component [Jatrophihabitans sp. GAS493]
MTAVITPDPTTVVTPGTPTEESSTSFAGLMLRRVGSAVTTVVLSLVVLTILWISVLNVFNVSKFVGKSPVDVYNYLFTDHPAPGVRPTTMTPEMARSQALTALWKTLFDAGIGFTVGIILALLIASLFVLYKPFEFAFMPIAMLLRSVPLVAMAPVVLLIVGRGTGAIATIGAIVVLFPALVNIVLGLRSTSAEALDVIRVNGGSERTALLKVRVPSALPNFFAAVRISVPGAVVGAMLAEWLSGFVGLGGLLSGYKGVANYTGVWTIVMLSVVASIVLYSIATIVETAVLAKWGPNAGKR